MACSRHDPECFVPGKPLPDGACEYMCRSCLLAYGVWLEKQTNAVKLKFFLLNQEQKDV